MDRYNYSVALVTVTDTEENARKGMYDNWREFFIEGDSQAYYETEFIRDGRAYKIVSAKQNEMGMTACAVLSMKLIAHFKPKYLIMIGLAAGVLQEIDGEQIYGDVVVADSIWNYSAGKFVPPDQASIKFGDIGFIPRPTKLNVSEGIEEYIRNAIQSDENEFHVYVGPMASGSTVVANSSIPEKQIRSQFSNTAGLDMESYAIAYAAHNAISPKPNPIVIKSVCDYADSRKSDDYQKFAAFTSAQFAKFLIEKHLPL